MIHRGVDLKIDILMLNLGFLFLQVVYFPLGEEVADLTGMVRDTIRLSYTPKVTRQLNSIPHGSYIVEKHGLQ